MTLGSSNEKHPAMTIEEKNQIAGFLNQMYDRINTAKNQIMECNYGMALKTLSEAYPVLKIKVEE